MMTNLNSKVMICVMLFVILLSGPTNASEDDIAETFRKGLEDFINGASTRTLNEAFEVFHFPHLFRKTTRTGSIQSNSICLACRIAMPVIMTALRSGIDTTILKNLVIILCIGMRIESESVCRQTINLHADIIFYIVKQKTSLTGVRFCSIVFQNFGCTDPNRKDWFVYVPVKPNIVPKLQSHKNESVLKVLQLTDVHYSLEYQVGSNAACGEPLCCQNGTKPEKPENAAKQWGDYRNCDVPWESLLNTMDQIISTHKDLDYVYFVGDIVDHKIWDTSSARNTKSITQVLNLFKGVFQSIPVFSVLGNHESHPVNLYSPDISGLQTPSQWVFEFIQSEWSTLLPDDTKGTILKGGYYTVLVKPGFRVVGLNSNVCYVYNWWLLYDDVDPYNQLEWLVLILLKAESSNEKVHILSHIPSGDSYCLKNWAREYSKIVARFSDTIVAQFNGHTHTIEKIIYYDTDDNNKPVNVAFNGGSLTPYSNVNPNYILYSVDGTNFEIIDYDLWIYDLEETNLNPNNLPRWFKLYTFKDAYNVSSLNPQEMNNLAKAMTKSCQLRNQYFRYKFKNAAPSLLKGCNKECDYQNICNLVTSYHGEVNRCDFIKQEMVTC